jgi:TM2 domain-containing membrane protein YozV
MSQQMNGKSTVAAYLLWFFLGAFGAHRFYMGRTGSGLGMLGLCLGSMLLSVFVIGLIGLPILAVWWLVDAFLIPRWMMDGLAAMPMPGGGAENVSRAA